jgi:hypothetical protein
MPPKRRKQPERYAKFGIPQIFCKKAIDKATKNWNNEDASPSMSAQVGKNLLV